MSPAPKLSPPQPRDLWPWLVFALALVLRVWAIDWGLPNAGRLFSYHPDESVVVTYSLTLDPLGGVLDPGFYSYGSLALLVNALFLRAGEALGFVATSVFPGVPSPAALLAARLATALQGAGTCWFVFHTGRLLFNRGAGLVAAVLYAVAPLAVQHGHFATVDVPATFWIAGALFFAARHLCLPAPFVRDLFWAGLWAGLAGATKYNAGLVLLAGIAAWWLRRPRSRTSLALLLGGALLGFVLGCPAVLLNPAGLVAGIADEARHVQQGHGLVFANTPPGLLYHAFFNLRWGLGAPLLLVVLAATAWALRRRSAGDLLLLAFVVPYYLLIGLAQVKFARYTLPLFPPLLLLAGALLTAPTAGWLGRLRMGAGILAAAYALLFSLALDATMTRPDPREQAAAFVRRSGFASVGFAVGPWFSAPPLHPLLAAFNPRAARQAASTAVNPRLIAADGEWNQAQLLATRPEAVVLSEFDYADALRTGHPPARAYQNTLHQNYARVRVFAQPMEVFGLRFTNLRANHTLPTQNLPHDMLYTNPTTVLWYR